jgi:hypothetical protein
MIASCLPLPFDPSLEPSQSQVDVEQGQFAQHVAVLDNKAFQKANWWRNLNRVMSGVGTLLIGVIVSRWHDDYLKISFADEHAGRVSHPCIQDGIIGHSDQPSTLGHFQKISTITNHLTTATMPFTFVNVFPHLAIECAIHHHLFGYESYSSPQRLYNMSFSANLGLIQRLHSLAGVSFASRLPIFYIHHAP